MSLGHNDEDTTERDIVSLTGLPSEEWEEYFYEWFAENGLELVEEYLRDLEKNQTEVYKGFVKWFLPLYDDQDLIAEFYEYRANSVRPLGYDFLTWFMGEIPGLIAGDIAWWLYQNDGDIKRYVDDYYQDFNER